MPRLDGDRSGRSDRPLIANGSGFRGQIAVPNNETAKPQHDSNESSGLTEKELDVVYGALANATRREMVSLLASHRKLSYTTLAEKLGIEVGSFYWHARKMRPLLRQNAAKEYKLSAMGRMAAEMLNPSNELLLPRAIPTEIITVVPPPRPKPSKVLVVATLRPVYEEILDTSPFRAGFEISLVSVIFGLLSSILGVRLLVLLVVCDDGQSFWAGLGYFSASILIILCSITASIYGASTVGLLRKPSSDAVGRLMLTLPVAISPIAIAMLGWGYLNVYHAETMLEEDWLQIIASVIIFVGQLYTFLAISQAVAVSFDIQLREAIIPSLVVLYGFLAASSALGAF